MNLNSCHERTVDGILNFSGGPVLILPSYLDSKAPKNVSVFVPQTPGNVEALATVTVQFEDNRTPLTYHVPIGTIR